MRDSKNRKIFLELGFIFSLLILIAAFKFTDATGKENIKIEKPSEDNEIHLVEARVVREKKSQPEQKKIEPKATPKEVPDEKIVERKVAKDIKKIDSGLENTTPEIAAPKAGSQRVNIPTKQNKVYQAAEESPTVIGSISKTVEYPERARRAKIQGVVYVQFTVEKTGEVTDIKILQSPNDLLSKAASNAVKDLRFNPGKQNGAPVRVRMSLPIKFELN